MTELSSDLLHLAMHERENVLRDRARREQRGVVRDRTRRAFSWPVRRSA